MYLLHGCTENIISFMVGHLDWTQELQLVAVHPLTALYCKGMKKREKQLGECLHSYLYTKESFLQIWTANPI